jgi:filamentous hemagglutinin family protein
MNKTFRSIWNATKQAYVAAAETVSAKGNPSSGAKQAAVMTALFGGLLGQLANAQAAPPSNTLPTGGQVSAGQASISQNGSKMLIQQGSDRAAINWQTFNVGSNAQVQFIQPSTSSVTVNKVMSGDPSQIFGGITSNGQVILTNPSGVYFGASARVDVGGLVATTHNISDTDLMAGNLRFERNGSTASVINEGQLKAALGGYIALLAPEVRNQGAIIAQMGTVALASGEVVDLRFDNNNRLTSLRVTPSQIQSLVDNRQAIKASDGLIIISAQSMDRLVGGVVKNSGRLEASSLVSKGGRIVLEGDTVELQSGSRLDATGATGGGTVLVGGDWQGSSDIHQATNVNMSQDAVIDASATQKGDGGKVVLWSDVDNARSVTAAQGTVYAKGGAQGGNGGQVETSGHSINIDSFRVDTRSASNALGKTGLWLIDPYDYTIGSTQAATISTALNSSDVTITTSSNVVGQGSNGNSASAGNITVSSDITGSNNLTMSADGDLFVNANIRLTGNGKALTLNTRGNFWTQVVGKTLVTNNGNLIINADSDANGSGQLELDYTTYSAGSGNILLRGYTFNFDTGVGRPNIATTGNFTLESNIGRFGQQIHSSWFNLAGSTLGGLTFGSLGSNTHIWVDELTVAGPITLNGGNIYMNGSISTINASNGNITINALGGLTNTNTSNINLAEGRSLNVNQVGTSTYYGVVSGTSANLNKSGAGTLTLYGANTYNGSTTVSGGTLAVAGSLNDSSALNISSGATYQLQSSDTVGSIAGAGTIDLGSFTLRDGVNGTNTTFSGVIQGTGNLTKVGSGITTLTGTSTYTGSTTVSAGTLQLGSGSTTGALAQSAPVTVAFGGTFAVNRSDDLTLFNPLSGAGTLRKMGSNTLTLNNSVSITGGATIDAGTLVLQNDVPAASGTFTGLGRLIVKPTNTSFTSAFNGNGWIFDSTLTGLTLGKSGNNANIYVDRGISINGPVSLYGGALYVDGGIATTSSGNIALTGSGDVTVRGNIQTAGSLSATTGSSRKFVMGLDFLSGVGRTISAGSGVIINAGTSYLTGNVSTNNAAIGINGNVQVADFSGNGITLTSGGGNIDLTGGTISGYASNLITYDALVTSNAALVGSGATITALNSNGTYALVTQFTGAGGHQFYAPTGLTSIQYLVVGGGGGGGQSEVNAYSGGTGGAGGMAAGTTALTGSTFALTVGAGGAMNVSGGDSGFNGIWSGGGGGGGGAFAWSGWPLGGYGNNNQSVVGRTYAAGGSGGGAGHNEGSGGAAGTGTYANGNYGGWSGGCINCGGGGGGAGSSANPWGGAGLASSITGTSVTYAAGGNPATYGGGGDNGYGGIGYNGSGGTVIVRYDVANAARAAGSNLKLTSGTGAVSVASTVSVSGLEVASSAASTVSGVISGTGSTLTNSGSGTLTLTANNTYTGATAINAGTLVLQNNVPTAASSSFGGSGALHIEPTDTSFTGIFSTNGWTFTPTLGGLTLGKRGNTSGVTIANATRIAGPISLYGGDIAINAELTATGNNTITLASSGTVTDGNSGYLSANNLLLSGGRVTLDNANNTIDTLAASGVSDLTYMDRNALTIGTVGSTNGVAATGVVSIGTQSGDLTVAQSLSTTNATATALTLNAGVGTAAGTSSGGNLIVSGSPSMSVGTGGKARLFTGSVSNSLGLTALVGSGSGRFRYNSDESATNYTATLSTGLNAIYREQPSVSVSVDNRTITYGDSLPTWALTSSGNVNGDTSAQVGITISGVTVGGSTSTSGNYVAGSHTLLGSGSLIDQLGYALSGSIRSGTLTVNQKAMTYSGSVAARDYDGTRTATVTNTTTGILTNDAVTLNSTGALFDTKDAGTGTKTVFVSGIALHGADSANYSIASTAMLGGATVNKKTVTLSASKTYDGTTDLTGDVALATGVGNETLSYIGATASNAHVATSGKYIHAITLSDATDGSGGLASNYQLPTLNATNAAVSIAAKALTANASIGGTLNKEYDGTTMASGASVSGNVIGAVSGDALNLNASGLTLAYNDAHVTGANQITANGSAAFSIFSSTHNSQASDYSFTAPTIVTASARITPRMLTATLTNLGVSKIYDGSTTAPNGFTPNWSFDRLLLGDSLALNQTGAAYDSPNVSTASKITVSGLSIGSVSGGNRNSAHSDYQLTNTSAIVAAGITAKTLTVSGLAVNGKTYDGTDTAIVSNWGALSTGVGNETLTLNHGTAVFTNVNAGLRTVSASGYSLANGSNGGLASNYQLTSTTATTTATISKATLTVTANNDAKFVTQNDTANFNDVNYSGFVHGETNSVLSGSASVTRNNASTNAAGSYNGVLDPSGSTLSANNYDIRYVAGNYTIVPSNQLLVRVANTSQVYGTAVNYNIMSAEYYNGSSVAHLNTIINNGNGSFTVSDGTAGGSATFTVTPTGSNITSTAGLTKAGSYQLGAKITANANTGNYSNNFVMVGAQTVTQKALTALVSNVSKVYDGTTAMNNLTLGLSGLEANDAVTMTGTGSYSNRNAGSNKSFSVTELTLTSADAQNYYLSGTSLSGSNGMITARPLTVSYTANGKTYDGSTTASVSANDNRISGDVLTISQSAAFTDKNAGIGKTVAISGISLDGADAGNYSLTNSNQSAQTTASIARLNSVTWTGGSSGNWFDQANWAGGAVPDLSNVANVVIPQGVNVSFGSTVVAPAQSGAVNIDSLSGANSSLSQSAGTLNVGSGGVILNSFNQSGGRLSSTGSILLAVLEQTDGSFSTGSDLLVTRDFSQSSLGKIIVGGNTSITDTSGGLIVGNLHTTGTTQITSTDGAISQASGTAVVSGGAATFTANSNGAAADITLNGISNDFQAPVNATGANVTLTDANALTLGMVKTGGNLHVASTGPLNLGSATVDGELVASSGNNPIVQNGALKVSGMADFDAGTSSVILPNESNVLSQGFRIKATYYLIAGDARKTANDAESKAQSNIPVRTLPGTSLTNVDAPPPLTMPPTDPIDAGSISSATADSGSAYSTGVIFDMQSSGQLEIPTMVAVSLPKGVSTVGVGFSFELPESVKSVIQHSLDIQATMANGAMLPSWLRFDSQAFRFESTSVPDGAFPLQIILTVGSQKILIVISERTE